MQECFRTREFMVMVPPRVWERSWSSSTPRPGSWSRWWAGQVLCGCLQAYVKAIWVCLSCWGRIKRIPHKISERGESTFRCRLWEQLPQRRRTTLQRVGTSVKQTLVFSVLVCSFTWFAFTCADLRSTLFVALNWVSHLRLSWHT